ncbi:glycosyltransferase family 41 protein [Cenococcum geophilum 1.58]|uniref:glycosyltransferase family 41 protein n=1 Tax=Cenococcum geophilum 1.58 TaxID=794803 RepID=UPI00358FD287|nr:glycosyltransferase family 41 protein [Cenococcum geophilum 1.58]
MTMVRQYPPQPQPQPQLFALSPSLGPYNSLPASPRAPRRNVPGYDLQSLGQQQLPQQYAHPLQRTNSYPQHGSLKEQGHERVRQSEHMLRRKTPNGILTAAYDGTSVEQTEKPHATKHILLPVTAAEPGLANVGIFPYTLKHELPLRSSGMAPNTGYNALKQEPPSGNWDPDMHFGFDPPKDSWKRAQHNLPQIDSMLNQMPLQQQALQYQHYGQQFCGAMEPSLQSPLGPTVSNDQGPYGPYWHDGTFIPYRPAALRDPRYYHHPASNWSAPQPHGYLSKGMGDWQSFNNTVPNINTLQHGHHHFPGSTPLPATNNYNIDTSPEHHFPYGFRSSEPTPQINHRRNLGLDYQGQNLNTQFGHRTPHTPQDLHQSLSSSGQSTPVPEFTPVSTPLSEFGPQSSNAQLRERVFTWAHTVYIDLLKYLQQTKRASAHSRHSSGHHPPRPNIYPKPPRQPGATFSSSNSINSRSHEKGVSTPIQSESSDLNLQNRELIHKTHAFHHRSSSLWSPTAVDQRDPDVQRRASWQQQYANPGPGPIQLQGQGLETIRTLRRTSGTSVSGIHPAVRHDVSPTANAASALEAITKHCGDSSWQWIDGMLLGGCLAYALGDYQKALGWYSRILDLDSDHVEAISNLAATLLALQRKQEAERYWFRAVKLRPSYFEAVEHLIGLLCGDHRGKDAVQIIEFVERSLKYVKNGETFKNADRQSERSNSTSQSPCISELSDKPVFDFDGENETTFKDLEDFPGSDQPGFGSSGYAIPGSENGRILALVHAKGNMLYALGDNIGAAKAFENAVLIGAGRRIQGIGGLIKHILSVVGYDPGERPMDVRRPPPSNDPILLHPEPALKTSQLCFPPHGLLPGLKHVPSEGMARKAAVSTTSNSLLSLAKIFQDGMAMNSPKASAYQTTYGVREILALYYLSLSLQPSPSTANNVGILLASVQQSAPSKHIPVSTPIPKPQIPGLVPGSGIALALAYYNYGLLLDSRHAHLYTNLGSLLKDIGQLDVAIQMYEQAVACDGNFDIALANLANAVKDKGRISDAIMYYRRAVQASPDFAEAVCGLANALNSVCGWAGRGGIATDNGSRDRWHVDEKGMLLDAKLPGAMSSGWIKRVVDLVEKQLADGEDWGRGIIDGQFIEDVIRPLSLSEGTALVVKDKERNMRATLNSWQGQKWEGARLVRLVERATRRLAWQWYQDKYIRRQQRPALAYKRPQLPVALTVPAAPTVLPFHTFTCPMSAKQIRLISQRNGLRISCSTLRAPWLPPTVFPPPPPPNPFLKVGYVSSDFNNHPLAHLMQSAFGLHNPARVRAYCYATTASDGSVHRQQIERESPVFYDASGWPAERLVNQIVQDGIHILINLNGYTRGARNEVFAARPAPIQMSFMGFAGTLGAEWCDYLLADETAVPPSTLRRWRRNIDMEDQLADENSGGSDDSWVYGENIIFCRDTFFCCDHRQSAPDSQDKQLNWEEEQTRRWNMRKEIFPNLPDDAIILGNFNQLYKIEPTTFRTWLRILAKLPKAILWLLRFPDLGEANLKQTAQLWAGPDVASRVLFTDVAPKHQHIARARVCDLFLDTPECNAHTTAADVLWSGTPLLTLPRYPYKMCSRMAASILKGALPKSDEGRRAARDLVVASEDEYEEQAVRLGRGCEYEGHRAKGRLAELRRLLYEARWTSALFDTRRWVRDLEEVYWVSWGKWERGEGGDIWLK